MFPVQDPVEAVVAALACQDLLVDTLLNQTVSFRRLRTPNVVPAKSDVEARLPALALFTGESLTFAHAVSFWNLRANGVRAAWIPLHQLETEVVIERLAAWLAARLGGRFHLDWAGGSRRVVAVVGAREAMSRVEAVTARLRTRLTEENGWLRQVQAVPDFAVEIWDTEIPPIVEAHVLVTAEGSHREFLVPTLPGAVIRAASGSMVAQISSRLVSPRGRGSRT